MYYREKERERERKRKRGLFFFEWVLNVSFQKRSIEFVDKIDPHTKISFAIHIESSIIDTSIAALFYARLPKNNDEHQSIGVVCIDDDDDDDVSLCLLLRFATAEDDFFEVIFVVCIQNTNNRCLCGVEKKKKDIGMWSTIRRTIERTFSDDAKNIGFGETTNDDGTKNMPRCCFRLERTTRGDSDDESSGRGRGWVVVSRDVE